jgi:restriction system protein
MPIWNYSAAARDTRDIHDVAKCPFCEGSLTMLFLNREGASNYNENYRNTFGHVCQLCGWWRVKHEYGVWGPGSSSVGPRFATQTTCAAGSLKNLDLTDLSLPLAEVRAFLIARYETRFSISPRLFEETVGSVFSDLGYDVIVTSYSSDGGIDAVLTKDASQIGVQVKRYRDSISVDQIREFLGALILARITKGIFVTTSRFQTGAYSIAERLETERFPIECVDLVDASRFYDALKLTQREHYTSKDDLIHAHGIDPRRMQLVVSFDGK